MKKVDPHQPFSSAVSYTDSVQQTPKVVREGCIGYLTRVMLSIGIKNCYTLSSN
jgi:hypothetical protein